MTKPIFIFDFDGTIADTHEYIINIFNRIAPDFGCKPIEPGQIEELKGKTSQEVIKILEIPFLKIPSLLSKSKKEFLNEIDHLEPFEGIIKTLQELNKNDVRLGMLSSNTHKNIVTFLENHNFAHVFDFISTTSKVWSKNTALKRLIKEKDFALSDIIYVGDETRDISAARAMDIKIASVTWGYNSKEILERHEPDFLIEHPRELLDLI